MRIEEEITMIEKGKNQRTNLNDANNRSRSNYNNNSGNGNNDCKQRNNKARTMKIQHNDRVKYSKHNNFSTYSSQKIG